MNDTNERSVASTGYAWSKDKPTAEGFYLYRDSRGQCLMQVGRYKDLQQGMPDALYAYPQSAGRSKSMGFDSVAKTEGEWINVTHRLAAEAERLRNYPANPDSSTLTDAEREDLRMWRTECLRQFADATDGGDPEAAERWSGRAERAAQILTRSK